jgi:hypothetical protein
VRKRKIFKGSLKKWNRNTSTGFFCFSIGRSSELTEQASELSLSKNAENLGIGGGNIPCSIATLLDEAMWIITSCKFRTWLPSFRSIFQFSRLRQECRFRAKLQHMT